MSNIILTVENISKHYVVKQSLLAPKTVIRAVDDVSFAIAQGETLGLIGESGCGKTTTGNLVLRLINPDSGKIVFDGADITHLSEVEMRKMRRNLQVIFQHSQEVLDSQMTIGELLTEPLQLHSIVPPPEFEREVKRLLGLVGLAEGERFKFPFQLSGGQKQRVGIARAIASRPKFVVCDEPVSALDVSIQGQILNLLLDLRQELQLTYLFISHDLKVVQHVCDRIAVMYKGRLVEIGNTNQVIKQPRDKYTLELVNSML
ncbi:MAG TPA: ATP-binding cassette domain-containing protein [Verrucomicrobiae bacterium]|nr:ATP-binding cassette domain-containing protein [Verrucomicrobiae bacterium]